MQPSFAPVGIARDGASRHALIRQMLNQEGMVADQVRRTVSASNQDTVTLVGALCDAYRQYCETGFVPPHAYPLQRRLYLATLGTLDDFTNQVLGQFFPPLPIDLSGTLFPADKDKLGNIVDALRTDGVYVFSQPLDGAFMERVNAAVNAGNAVLDNGRHIPERYGDGNRYRRIFALEKELVRIPEFVSIATDPLVLAAVQGYFGCQPILNQLASYRTNAEPEGGFINDDFDTAQAYHFDYHCFRWLKLFVYLSDVGEDNGPHHFIRTSHRQRANALWRDGRIPDAEIVSNYPEERITKVVGPVGTAFLADTAAFHRGCLPERGYRALGQFEYCDTLFGPYAPVAFDHRKDGAFLLDRSLACGPRVASRLLMQYL